MLATHRSNDGLTLYAVSSDGTLAAFAFDATELEGLAPLAAQKQYLTKFGFSLPDLPAGYSHTQTPPPSNSATPLPNVNVNGGEVVNKLVAKRNVKKRVSLARPGNRFGDVPSAAMPGAQNSRPPVDDSPFNAPFSERDADVDMFPPSFNDFGDSFGGSSNGGGESSRMVRDIAPAKGRTLGGDRPREAAPSEVRTIRAANDLLKPLRPSNRPNNITFDIPPALNYISHQLVEVDDAVLEARNAESGDLNEVAYIVEKQTQWLDYLPSPVILLTANNFYCCVATLDSRINVYSHSGRRVIPTLTLDGPAAFLCTAKSALVILTASGTLHSFETKTGTALFTPVSVRPLLSNTISLVSLGSRANGAPVLVTSTGAAHAYDPKLQAFVLLADTWWAKGSDVWIPRSRGPPVQPSTALAAVEAALANSAPDLPTAEEQSRDPEWWREALTLGHLEARMHGASVLDSGVELKQALLVYAKKIADEGFAGKADEVIKELFGPIYWCVFLVSTIHNMPVLTVLRRRPGSKATETWQPKIAQLNKRDLLKDVLQIFARSKTLQRMAHEWQDLLRKVSSAGEDFD